MRIAKVILIIVIAAGLGYVVGNVLPFSAFKLAGKGIEGDAELTVKVMMDNSSPLDRIEVDLAEEPGSPPSGGVAMTDKSGLAVFKVKPGSYFVFFNQSNFPGNLEMPAPQPVEVLEGVKNKETVTVTTK